MNPQFTQDVSAHLRLFNVGGTCLMELEEIKKEMKKYRDLYGGELLDYAEIDNCKNLLDCESLIERHRSHMADMLSDADRHLDNFRKRIGVW